MLIVPESDELTRPYWDAARRGQLKIQRCGRCSCFWHPPLPICPQCRSRDIAWTPVSGRGTVYSYTIVHHPAHIAVADRVPYLVALISLDEGPRMVSNILGCDPDEVRIGMPVVVTFQEIAQGIVLPQFARAAPDGERRR